MEEKFVSKRKNLIWKKFWNQRYIMILVLPAVLWMLIFSYLPMLGIILAFKNYNPFLGNFLESFIKSPWVGINNFIEIFTDKYFLQALRNTIYYSVLNLIIGFPFPIVFALLLNEITNIWFKKFVQTASYLPYFISWVFVIGFIYDIFSDNGVVNGLLLKLNIIKMPISFLVTPKFIPPIVVLSNLWKVFGWNSIIYLAAIASIDPTLYEAATVDGANRFAQIWHITLPLIKPTIIVLLIFNIAGLITNYGLFEQMYLLSNSAIQDVTEIIDTYTYKMGIVLGRYSYATAVGLFRSLAAIILLASANFISKKLFEEGLF
jgi:putative aldouronate transport system permease protein